MGNERRSCLLIHLVLSLEETKNETILSRRLPDLHTVPFYADFLLPAKTSVSLRATTTQLKRINLPDSFVANSQVAQFWSMRHMQKSLGISGKWVFFIFLDTSTCSSFSFCQGCDHNSWRYSNRLSIMSLKSHAMNEKERKQKSRCSVHEHLCWLWISCPI